MSHDEPEALPGAAAGSLLHDMVHASGMLPWIQDLGLNSHVASFAVSSENADENADVLHLDAHDDAAARGKRAVEPVDSPLPSKRPARNLDYGGADANHEAVQGMLHLDGDRSGNGGSADPVSAKAREAPSTTAAGRDDEAGAGSRFLTAHAVTAVAVRVKHEEDDLPPRSPVAHTMEAPTPSSSGPRRDKGLRSFSLKVCQKVEERDVTTYNEVADELVKEFKLDPSITFDEKNIRRRIYDALNVLMAMDIITRDKKNIRWKGFPQSLEKERELVVRRQHELQRELQNKYKEVEKKALQYISLCNIMKRNASRPLAPDCADTLSAQAHVDKGKEAAGALATEGRMGERGGKSAVKARSAALKIPFVIVQTQVENEIHLEYRNEKKEALLSFDKVGVSSHCAR